jgi:hypothetical protein
MYFTAALVEHTLTPPCRYGPLRTSSSFTDDHIPVFVKSLVSWRLSISGYNLATALFSEECSYASAIAPSMKLRSFAMF